jgi:hypothetical protein
VIDHDEKAIYSLECKNANGARNIHEMKLEIDGYLGRRPDDPEAKINKHLRRHQWLETNKAALASFVSDPASYQLRSVVLTADELSLTYLKSRAIPLPIKSFIFLRKVGITYLKRES